MTQVTGRDVPHIEASLKEMHTALERYRFKIRLWLYVFYFSLFGSVFCAMMALFVSITTMGLMKGVILSCCVPVCFVVTIVSMSRWKRWADRADDLAHLARPLEVSLAEARAWKHEKENEAGTACGG